MIGTNVNENMFVTERKTVVCVKALEKHPLSNQKNFLSQPTLSVNAPFRPHSVLD